MPDDVLSTREAFRLTNSRYFQGQALQIELIDARTQMTNAEINYSVARLAVLNKLAELERVTATYPLPESTPAIITSTTKATVNTTIKNPSSIF